MVANDRLALVLRRGGPGAEIYGLGGERPTLRAVLTPAAESPPESSDRSPSSSNGPGEVALDGVFSGSGGKTVGVRLELAMGQPFVKTEPREGTTGVMGRGAVPVHRAARLLRRRHRDRRRRIPVAAAEMPSENFLLHLLPDRDAIVMTVASNRAPGRADRAGLPGRGQRPQRQAHQPQPDGLRRRRQDLGRRAPGRTTSGTPATSPRTQAGKVLGLDWTAPFAAQWRVDWRLADRLTGSWEMLSNFATALHEARLVRQSRTRSARPQALDDRAGLVPVSLLDRSRRPRASATVGQARTVFKGRP